MTTIKTAKNTRWVAFNRETRKWEDAPEGPNAIQMFRTYRMDGRMVWVTIPE